MPIIVMTGVLMIFAFTVVFFMGVTIRGLALNRDSPPLAVQPRFEGILSTGLIVRPAFASSKALLISEKSYVEIRRS